MLSRPEASVDAVSDDSPSAEENDASTWQKSKDSTAKLRKDVLGENCNIYFSLNGLFYAWQLAELQVPNSDNVFLQCHPFLSGPRYSC
jgi:hypothetical protein